MPPVPKYQPIHITDGLTFFTITVGTGTAQRVYYFNHEEHKRRLVKLFHHLGHKKVTYSEDY